MKTFGFFLLAILPSAALAAGAKGEGIPVQTIIAQVVNLTILFGALIYFFRGNIKQAFIDRKSLYLAAAQKSAAAREEAEKHLSDLKSKIEKLETQKDSELKKAEHDAVLMKAQILAEAQSLSAKIRAEAELTAKVETAKAEAQLKSHLLTESIAAAKMILAKDINSQDHEKLQTEFVKHVQGAQP